MKNIDDVSKKMSMGAALHHKYKNIIFDVGAVLVSWNPDEILKSVFGTKISPAVVKYFDSFNSGVWRDLDRGVVSYAQVGEVLEKDLGKVVAAKLASSMIDYLNPISEGISIFNQIKTLGYKTYILSNMSEPALQKIAAENDFVRRVDGAIWSYKVKCIKPEPEIYQILLQQYSLRADECIFIDDREENINAAKVFGIDGILCKDHNHVRQEMVRLKII